ncbi:hypothetical protein AC1031_014726 [Aphanomyces cochlioides]|nr:hypothetical protein AC1031_014726 [Aphanomyces cochlioides]
MHDSDDDDIEIITPVRQKRPRIDEDDEDVTALTASQQTDEEIIVSSGSKKKKTVVLDDSDIEEVQDAKQENNKDEDEDDAMPLASFVGTPSKETSASSPSRRHSFPETSSRRSSRRLSDRSHQKEVKHHELKQKLQRKSLDTCLPERTSDGEDDYVAESDEDNFVVYDDEVEYMDEDEEPAVANGNIDDSDDEEEEDIHAFRGSREPIDWFRIYMAYLENCLADEEFELSRKDKVFNQSIEHIERALLQRRDSLRGNVFWPDDLVESINTLPVMFQGDADGENLCYACNRSRHPASVTMHFIGVMCDANELYRKGWRQHLFACLETGDESSVQFEVGSRCFQRVLLYWCLHQAKRMWCSILWRKMNEYDGKIPEEERAKLHKSEFGRYKKLLNMVDNLETKEGYTHVRNIWSGVSPMSLETTTTTYRRRGDVTSLIDDEEEEKEETKDSDNEEEKEEKDEEKPPSKPKASPTPPSTPSPAPKVTSAPSTPAQAGEDMCLVCNQRRRSGGILHGYYVHIYSCFECAKKLKEQKEPCAVCSRPIERVIHLLRINDEEERRIRLMHASS